jgi:hypothetical protein
MLYQEKSGNSGRKEVFYDLFKDEVTDDPLANPLLRPERIFEDDNVADLQLRVDGRRQHLVPIKRILNLQLSSKETKKCFCFKTY